MNIKQVEKDGRNNNRNIIHIRRYSSLCGDLMLGSFGRKLCLCDWTAERHRGIVDARLRRIWKADYEEQTSGIINETIIQLDDFLPEAKLTDNILIIKHQAIVDQLLITPDNLQSKAIVHFDIPLFFQYVIMNGFSYGYICFWALAYITV